MIIEISVAVIAGAFLLLSVFLVISLLNTNKTVKALQKDIHHLSNETVKLVENTDEFVTDVKRKSQAMNFLFRPFMNRERAHREERSHSKAEDTVAAAIDWVVTGVDLLNQIKGYLKDHGK
jgi:Na+-translocating ferredoxin:NAD+ oxidoreductase RnfC subunit